MTETKARESLHHPIARAKWEAARASERITYAQPDDTCPTRLPADIAHHLLDRRHALLAHWKRKGQ